MAGRVLCWTLPQPTPKVEPCSWPRVQVSLVLAVGSSRKQVIDLMEKYGDSHSIDHAMDFAWESAQLELRLLRIQT